MHGPIASSPSADLREPLLTDIASRDVSQLAADNTLGAAAELMAQRGISSIVVADDGGAPTGIVTERDVLRALQSGLAPTTPLQQIMSAPVVSVPQALSLNEAYRLCLSKNIRHLVILDDEGRLAGVISETDFRLHLSLSALAGRRRIATLSGHTSIVLPPSTGLAQILELMLTQRQSCVVAVEDDKPVGIVTERDLVRFYSDQSRDSALTLRDVMTSPVRTIPHDATTTRAAEEMLAHRLRHLVVVDDAGNMAGVVSEHDLTRAMASIPEEARDGLEENFLRTLIDTLPDLVWLKDENGVYLACNARFEQFFGARERDIVGKTDYDFVESELADSFRANDLRAMTAGKPSRNEEWLTFASDGYRGLFEAVKTPMHDARGRLIGVLGMARDITERVDAARAMNELNAELSATLQAVPDLLFELDRNGRYLQVWAHDPSLLATQRDLLIGRTVAEALPPAAAAIVMEAIALAENRNYASGQVIHLELPRGESWFELSTAAKSGGNFIMMSRDITSRILAENALREREEVFSTIVNQAVDSIVLIDSETLRFVEFNRAAHESLGYTREEFVALTVADVQAQLAEAQIKQRMQQSIVRDDVLLFETLHRRKDGSLRETRISSRPVRIHGKTYLSAIWSDISEHKAAERQIAQTRQALDNERTLFQAILDNAPLGIWYLGIDNRLQFVNRTFCEALGIPEQTFLAEEHYASILPPAVAASCMLSDKQCFASDTPVVSNEWLPFVDGKEHLLEVTKVRLDDAEGKPKGLIALASDITQRHEQELHLKQLNFALDHVGEGAYLTDEAGCFLYVNTELSHKLGYNREQLLHGMRVTDVRAGWDSDRWAAHWNDIRQNGTRTLEVGHRTRSGDIIQVEISANHFEFDGRHYNMTLVRDITERKQMERQLEDYRKRLEGQVVEESTKFRALVEQSLVGIYIIQDKQFRYVNAGFADIFGYASPADIVDLVTIDDLVAPEDRENFVRNIGLRLDGAAEVIRYSLNALRFDGSRIVIDVHGRRIDYQGRPAIIGTLVDITEERRTREELLRLAEQKAAELHRKENIYSAVFSQADSGIELIDPETLQFVEVNDAVCRMLGYSREELLGMHLTDTQADFGEAEVRESVQQLPARKGAKFENRHRCKDGSILDVEVRASVLDIAGRQLIVAVWNDITERKRAEDNLRITASVFDKSQEGIVITDADNRIIDVNPAFTRITGYTREEALGKNPSMLSSGRHSKEIYREMWQALKTNDSWRGEIWDRRKSGEVFAELLSISVIRDEQGNTRRHVAVFTDISHLKQHEEELSRIAHFDALTGIPNRVLLADRMQQGKSQTRREGNMMAVCYLDLDGFKAINDSLGHKAGDDVLIEVAQRILKTIRGGDTVARLGGDEFVVLLLGLERAEECAATLERLLHEIAQPIKVSGQYVSVGASIGVSIFPLDDENADTLLRHADQAMYVAKQAGKHRFHIYDPTLDQRARSQNEFVKQVRHALAHRQFELYYQPKIKLCSKKLVGAEALIRWNHPERGLLAPGEFLHAIENTELDIALGEWVIETALQQLQKWRETGLEFEVSVNISAFHLESPGFIDMLRGKLARHPELPAGSLQIELLETAALADIATVNGIIAACRELGVGFALDDFGTGFSSLSYLSRLPVDALKIDQSFVRDMLDDKGDLAIVHGIVALARAFERQTVAEGIETEQHFSALLESGCILGQGYYIARPMPAGELSGWRIEID